MFQKKKKGVVKDVVMVFFWEKTRTPERKKKAKEKKKPEKHKNRFSVKRLLQSGFFGFFFDVVSVVMVFNWQQERNWEDTLFTDL